MTENKPLTSIRGFAALWVVGHHWFDQTQLPWVRTIFEPGYRAVDIFFALSGLILTLVYARLPRSKVPQFFVQRVFRVYPVHIFSLLLLTVIVELPNVQLHTFLTPDYAGSLLLLQPFIRLNTAMNPVAWSIGIEFVFYLLFPVLLFLLNGVERTRFKNTALVVLVGVLVCAQFYALRVAFGETFGPTAVGRGIASFMLGMVLAKFRNLFDLSFAGASAIELLSCLGIALAVALHYQDLIPFLAVVLIVSLSFDVGVVAIALRHRICHWLGQISFSVYLLHYAIQVSMDKFVPFKSLATGTFYDGLIRWTLLASVLLMVSSISYRFIEVPFRRIPARLMGMARRPGLPATA